ncbi:MAG: hypothetical protein ABII25_05845, partial [bacterium]
MKNPSKLLTAQFLILDSHGKETALSVNNIETVKNQFDSALTKLLMVVVTKNESIHFANHM